MPKPEIIKALLKAGADVNAKLGEEWSEKDTSALYRAVEGESLECVELIVAAGADLDYMNDRKVFKVDESPLMAYISRSWNKLDGSDTVEVEEMLGAAST